jgi:hypothetical protein
MGSIDYLLKLFRGIGKEEEPFAFEPFRTYTFIGNHGRVKVI